MEALSVGKKKGSGLNLDEVATHFTPIGSFFPTGQGKHLTLPIFSKLL